MKAITMFALALLMASSASAGGMGVSTTIEYIPVDEAAAARMPAPSADRTCQSYVQRAADEYLREVRERRAHHEASSSWLSYRAAGCGNKDEFSRKMVEAARARAKRNPPTPSRDGAFWSNFYGAGLVGATNGRIAPRAREEQIHPTSGANITAYGYPSNWVFGAGRSGSN